jgi:hypothetical protein
LWDDFESPACASETRAAPLLLPPPPPPPPPPPLLLLLLLLLLLVVVVVVFGVLDCAGAVTISIVAAARVMKTVTCTPGRWGSLSARAK